MKLTNAERLILHNQYEILSKINPSQAKDYEIVLECLYNGYEEDFDHLLPHFEPPQNPTVRTQVREILEMFRSLTPNAGSGRRPPVKFAGFDGNEETEHYAYARFLLDSRGLWRESRPKDDDYNTHSPVLDDYLSMLGVWNRAADKNNLTSAEIKEIVDLAPHLSKVD